MTGGEDSILDIGKVFLQGVQIYRVMGDEGDQQDIRFSFMSRDPLVSKLFREESPHGQLPLERILERLPEDVREKNRAALEEAEATAREYLRRRSKEALIGARDAWTLLAAFDRPNPGEGIYAAIEHVLKDTENDVIALTTLQEGNYRDQFARRLLEHVSELRTFVKMRGAAPCDEEDAMWPGEYGDHTLLWWDDRLAHYIERIGDHGKRLAKEVRNDACQRWENNQRQLTMDGEPENGTLWSLWLDYSQEFRFPFLEYLARTVWEDQIRPTHSQAIKDEARKYPGVPAPIFSLIADRQVRGTRIEENKHGQLTLFSPVGGEVLTQIPNVPGVTPNVLRRAAEQFGSINSYRAIKWIIQRAHLEHADGWPHAGNWVFEGGAGFAAAVFAGPGVDLTSIDKTTKRQYRGRQAKEFEDIARYLMLPMADPSAPQNWITLAGGGVTVGRGSRPGRIELSAGAPLRPGWVFHYRKGDRARKIVPVTELPPLVASTDKYGAQAWFWWRFVAEVRLRAAQVAERGGALLRPKDLAVIADASNLSRETIPELLDAWADDSKAPPSIERRNDLYRLGPAHPLARAAIEQEGRKELLGAKGIPPGKKRRK